MQRLRVLSRRFSPVRGVRDIGRLRQCKWALHVVERERVKLLAVGLVAAVMLFVAARSRAETSKDDVALVKRGEYLARAANCFSCHTKPGESPFTGGVPLHTPFGTVYSTNITPDTETGIGHWTEPQFLQAMREGIRPNGEHLYPAFPYTAFTKLADADIAALFAYLKTVPSVRSRAVENKLSFPFSYRALMVLWKALFFENTRFALTPGKSAEWNRGAYLVEALGHCGACHTPRNLLGAERAPLALTGGTFLDKVPGGQIRPWSAVNLTQAASGLASWSVDDIVAYLKTGVNPFATVFGPMNDVFMNSTRHVSDSDARAIAIYLKSLSPHEPDVGSAMDIELSMSGESLYANHCGTCHLPTGKGAVETGPALRGNPVVQSADPTSLINVILFGPELSDPPPPVQRPHMEPYDSKLSDEEIAALANYLRSAWGNVGGEVSAKQVAAQR
jgi:mono/diheme cytochrome c family protein